jgi:hypothetical protein
MRTEINNVHNLIALNFDEYVLTHADFRIASISVTWLAVGVNERM